MKKQGGKWNLAPHFPLCYCRWGVSAPLSQDSPSTALSQLPVLAKGRHAVPAAEAGFQRSSAGTERRGTNTAGTSSDLKIPPQQSQVFWEELQESTTTLLAALVARWNTDTILLHFQGLCAHTNILLIAVGNAAHTIASLP